MKQAFFRGKLFLLTCWEHGFPPGGNATGKWRARWGGTIFFFFKIEFSQCAVIHLFLSLKAYEDMHEQLLKTEIHLYFTLFLQYKCPMLVTFSEHFHDPVSHRILLSVLWNKLPCALLKSATLQTTNDWKRKCTMGNLYFTLKAWSTYWKLPTFSVRE